MSRTPPGRTLVASMLALCPVLVAAADPPGDVTACPPGSSGAAGDPRIDLLAARGEIIERGTALRFIVSFDDVFEAPDTEGSPLRVDVVLRDPDVPTVSFRYYRDLNRIVRFDAVPDPALQIVLLPEEGANVSLGGVALGDTVTMTLPGRLVTRDADLEGLGLERMRWSVIARDEGDCDALGDGRPTHRLTVESASDEGLTGSEAPPTPSPTRPTSPPAAAPPPDDRPAWLAWSLAAGAVLALVIRAIVIRRRGSP